MDYGIIGADEESEKQRRNFDALQDALNEKGSLLLSHENKESAICGLPYLNRCPIPVGNKVIYTVTTDLFKMIIQETILLDASYDYPENFGAKNPMKVIEALYKTTNNGATPSLEQAWAYMKDLSHENFCFAAEIIDGQVIGEILRIDLFRDIKIGEFTGGLFHVFKHFSNIKGIPLSTHPKEYKIAHPSFVLNNVLRAFFTQNLNQGKGEDNYETAVAIDKKKSLKIGFFKETKCSDVYFVNTAHIITTKR